MKQIPLPMVVPPEERFDTLVVGPNTQAVQHLRHLGQQLAGAAPVYLWGAEGTGKTRLLRALVAERQAAGHQVGWLHPALGLPWVAEEGWSLVVLDDCHLLNAAQQQAAFALFVEAGSMGWQWAAAGALPPVDLPLRDDLRSRLGWGHVFALQPLADDDAAAVLRREAQRRGIVLGDEVVAYLLTRFERSLTHLMHLLDRLDGFAMAEQRAVTVPLLKKMLNEQTSGIVEPMVAATPPTDA
jgi:DnaA family protein